MVLIVDLVEAVLLPENPYMKFLCCLLAVHQLPDIQMVEQLFNLPPLTSKKPSELLAEMLRLCPKGKENNAFYHCLFLNKLAQGTLCAARRRSGHGRQIGILLPTSANCLLMWEQQLASFLSRILRERTPRRLQSVPGLAAVSAAAGADSEEERASWVQRSPDTMAEVTGASR